MTTLMAVAVATATATGTAAAGKVNAIAIAGQQGTRQKRRRKCLDPRT